MTTFIWWYADDETYLPYTDILIVKALTLNAARAMVAAQGDERAIELSLYRPEAAISDGDSIFFERSYRGT